MYVLRGQNALKGSEYLGRIFDVKLGPLKVRMFNVFLEPLERSEFLTCSSQRSGLSFRLLIFSLCHASVFRRDPNIVSLRFRLNYTCGVLQSYTSGDDRVLFTRVSRGGY